MAYGYPVFILPKKMIKFILGKKEVPFARKIVNAYENNIKQHIDILQEFLLNYKRKERIIVDITD